jgi:hypothetical protein
MFAPPLVLPFILILHSIFPPFLFARVSAFWAQETVLGLHNPHEAAAASPPAANHRTRGPPRPPPLTCGRPAPCEVFKVELAEMVAEVVLA